MFDFYLDPPVFEEGSRSLIAVIIMPVTILLEAIWNDSWQRIGLYQGILQIAVGLYHLKSQTGAWRSNSSRRRYKSITPSYLPEYQSIDVENFIRRQLLVLRTVQHLKWERRNRERL
jgi:hypothetical protein